MPLRDKTIAFFRAPGAEVYANLRASAALAVGDRVRLSFTRYHLFEDANGLRVSSPGYA
ncbi:MAG: hypothetical protein Q8M76_12700 [Spirochaetaceae bacterium]|nr:hypothetical protein [Spirochaetaceae bacterium]